MEIIAQEFKLENDFIYEGIQNKYLRRRMKKKFDNLIAELKRSLAPGLFVKTHHSGRPKSVKRKRIFSKYPSKSTKKNQEVKMEEIVEPMSESESDSKS